MYYYASRNTKDAYLVTSYGNKASQQKYGGTDAKYFTGVRVFNPETDDFAEVEGLDNVGEHEMVVRSYMKGAISDGAHKYLIYNQEENGEWKKTEFGATTYGDANSLMKALISIYGTLMIIEKEPVAPKEKASFGGAPF